eukprot:3263014-Pleurochrysis_carterae.AAC.1
MSSSAHTSSAPLAIPRPVGGAGRRVVSRKRGRVRDECRCARPGTPRGLSGSVRYTLRWQGEARRADASQESGLVAQSSTI